MCGGVFRDPFSAPRSVRRLARSPSLEESARPVHRLRRIEVRDSAKYRGVGLLIGVALALGLLNPTGNAAPPNCSRNTARSLERTLPPWRSYIKRYAGQGQVLCFDFTG